MISVCLATYNGEDYIKDQLDSILSQISGMDEVIISDDNSNDSTLKIVQSFNDPRIKVHLNKLGKGYSRNFENAITQSKGDIIFLSDQDDIWKQGKVTMMLEKLNDSPMVISNAEIVDAELNSIHNSHFQLRGVKNGFWVNFLKTRYIGACMAFRREILKKALPFPKNQVLCAYDYWLTLVSEFYYKVSLVEEPLILYRRHNQNASTGGDLSKNSLAKKIKVRVYSLFNLLIRVGR